MIVRKDATHNFAATEDDDFDALLNASSLGAPHVVAETEPIPADVRRRLSRAAARTARREAATPPSKQADCAPGDVHGRLSTPLDEFVRKLEQPAIVMLVGQVGSGKSTLLHTLLSVLADPRATAWPTWRQKVRERALEDCGHLAGEPWHEFGRRDWALTAWPADGAGSGRGALLRESFSRNMLCTPCAELPLYVKDYLPAAPQASRRILQPAHMTELLALGQGAPVAPAALPWREPRQEASPGTLVLLDCCGQDAKQLRPAVEPFLDWLEQPTWSGAEYGAPLLTPRSSHVLSSLHAGFSPVPADLHTSGRYLPLSLPYAETRRWHALRSRLKALYLRAGEGAPDTYGGFRWRQERSANTSLTSAPRLLVYLAGHAMNEDCSTPRRGEPEATWPELMWTEQADGGVIEHALVPMTVHQKKRAREAEVPVLVTYRSGDPYAIEAIFYRGEPGDEVVWSFARDLLIDGLQHSGGEGDVTVWTPPDPPTRHVQRRTFIQLSSPEGTALLSAPHAQLKRFVDRTLLLVAAGSEHQRFGSALDRLESELGELTCPGFGD
ncbi:SsgA family sporulation/cell division regulator [Streptomyces sp. NPDC097941]|uniref:SsgA family sporulation/cell division regulator n=1 Tax=Streptomyces sp. NPDC097941 TaxID=3155685 RepID=UPI0033240810